MYTEPTNAAVICNYPVFHVVNAVPVRIMRLLHGVCDTSLIIGIDGL